MMKALPFALAFPVFGLVSLMPWGESEARADTIIKHPGQHLDYKIEIEPHLNVAFWHYRSAAFKHKVRDFGDTEFGGGLRFTIPLVDRAFIPKLNNSVGITFGLDVTGCTSHCYDRVHFRTPVGIQWAFHITREFDAFADLGFLLHMNGSGVYPDFFAMAGARYLFSDKAALTVRIGYPFISVGVSLFAG